MPEVIGLCKSNDEEKMIIIDLDGDDIRMDNVCLKKLGEENYKTFMDHFNFLVGKKISYYYDNKGVRVRVLKEDDIIVYQQPDNIPRTLKSIKENSTK